MTGPATAGLLQLLAYLFLFLGLMAAGWYIQRKGLLFSTQKNKSPRKLVVSETRMMGNRQFLVVAEYEGKKMLIGVCPGRIDYLCSLGGGESDAEGFSSMLPEAPE